MVGRMKTPISANIPGQIDRCAMQAPRAPDAQGRGPAASTIITSWELVPTTCGDPDCEDDDVGNRDWGGYGDPRYGDPQY